MKKALKTTLLFLKETFKYVIKAWSVAAKVVGSFVLGFIILIIFIIASASDAADDGYAGGAVLREGGLDKVAVVRLNGEIMELDNGTGILDFNPFLITPTRTRELFQRFAKDDSIKAIVIHINSPGGSVVASEEIYQQIRALREIKPVIASFGEVSASGGYYIACAADQIVANPATITGSIGVIAIAPNVSGLYDKLGIEMTTFKTGQYKDMGSMARAVTEEEQEIFKSILDDSYGLFVRAIVDGRNMDESKVRKLADGRIYSGKQARENGLVDKLGGIDTAIDLASDIANLDNPTVMEYGTYGWLESFLGSSGSSFLPNSFLNQLAPQRKTGIYFLWN